MIVEAAVCASLVAIALSSVLMVVIAFGHGARTVRENAAAEQALRAALETLQETPFRQAFASFNANPGDDPLGPGSAPGPDFAVPDLQPQPGDPDGMVGRFEFPEIAGGPALREDVVDLGFAMPRDLNADGALDNADHSADYVLLPVRLRLSWTGSAGQREMTVNQLLSVR